MILVITVFICFVAVSLYIASIFSLTVDEPYMDEVFHIPQAKQYCSSNFSHWDPMITTLPGLYLVSVGALKPVSFLLDISLPAICQTSVLRGVNLLFTFGNFYLIYSIVKKLHNPLLDPDGIKLVMTSFALSTFPVLYFFTFLYYTDPGSTFFVLIMYLFCLHDSHRMAAIFGVAAIFFRQTNIIWVVFMAGLVVRKELCLWIKQLCEKKDIALENLSDVQLLKVTFQLLHDCTKNKQWSILISLVVSILKHVWCYLLVGAGFVVFVLVNDGIVVGARTHHVACLHFPQLFYFLTMTNFFSVFHMLSPYKLWAFLKSSMKQPFVIILFCIVAFLMVNYFTYEHEYLLADNRHFAFYIWRRIYKRHEYVKFALIPVYYLFFWSFIDELKHRDIYWKLVFAVCLLATTVPQKLLEYRYFILPYLIFRMNMRYGTAVGLLHEILLYLAVNGLTIYLFLQRPFKWPHEDGVQRFMW